MEYLKSTWMLLWGVIRRWYLLLPSLLTDPFDIAESFGKSYTPSLWVTWLLFGIGGIIALVLTYHELRRQIVTNEWEYRRKALIEQRTPNLPKIGKALDVIEQRTHEIVKSTATNVDPDILQQVTDEVVDRCNIYSSDPNELLKYLMAIRFALDAAGIGLQRLIDDDAEWKRRFEQYRAIERKSVADKRLNKLLDKYWLLLYGTYSHELFGRYVDATFESTLKEKYAAVGSFVSRLQSLRAVEVDIRKRLEELMAGDSTI